MAMTCRVTAPRARNRARRVLRLEAIREELLSRALPAGAHPIPPANAVVEP